MPKYLITYHGGDGMPASEEARRQMMDAFMAWVKSTGDAMVDPGAPLGQSTTVTSSGESGEPPAGRVAGYTLVEAANLDAAVGLARSHPFVVRGGALLVSESVAP